MTERLWVWGTDPDPDGQAESLRVGELTRQPDGDLAFEYDAGWLKHPSRFPLSWSLPLADYRYAGVVVQSFFQNLLPEGQARRAVAQRLGLSEDNDWALLIAIGGECAGALSIVAPDQPAPSPSDWRYEPISQDTLQKLAERKGVVPLLVGGTDMRLSLAGAQDKVPVAVIDGQLHLPMGSAPSTFILKLPNRDFEAITVNEAFITALAREAGLDAVDSELLMQTSPPCLLVRRFDRYPATEARPTIRIHQEDLCQALGLPAGRKYEQEGGPTLAKAAMIVRQVSVDPLRDVQTLIRWTAFNICAGNADAHGKNLALLHRKGGISLAPLYDLVSTRHFPRLDRRFAMSIGGHRDMDSLTKNHWAREAKNLEMGRPIVLKLARAAADAVIKALPKTRAAFVERYGPQPILDQLPDSIEQRTNALLYALS